MKSSAVMPSASAMSAMYSVGVVRMMPVRRTGAGAVTCVRGMYMASSEAVSPACPVASSRLLSSE